MKKFMKINFMPDAFIFDVDGVLLNVERSFPEVIRQGIRNGWASVCGGLTDSIGYTFEHEKIFKRHGSFNDDYDIAWTMLSIAAYSGNKKLSEAIPTPKNLSDELLTFKGTVISWVDERFGTPVPRDQIRELCAGLYIGSNGDQGLHRLEVPMLRVHWSKLPLPVGVYTGRNLIEWELAKKALGWQDFPEENIIHSDTGIYKPSPRGLEILSERLGCKDPVFFGDTGSDMKAQAAFGKGYFVAIGALLPEADYVYKETEIAVREINSLIEEE
ncbi:MAG: HAD family hydrolase [Synergistaceae bacterium]|nr:HAD family hydrolase [Synergistaceae bacterium]